MRSSRLASRDASSDTYAPSQLCSKQPGQRTRLGLDGSWSSGTVAFAAVVLAIQDHYSMQVNSTEEAGPVGSVIAKFFPQENRYPHLENAGATPFPVLALTPSHDYGRMQVPGVQNIAKPLDRLGNPMSLVLDLGHRCGLST